MPDEEVDSFAEWELHQRRIWAQEAGLDARTADLLALRAELDAHLAAVGSDEGQGRDAVA